MKKVRFLGFLFLFIGMGIFFSNSSITGAVIGASSLNNFSSFLSIALFFVGIYLIFVGGIENKILSSKVKEDPLLLRIAENIGKKESIKRDINHLIAELNKGNTNPGIGTKTISKGLYELRGRNEGRVYYREIQKGKYEILGYSDKDSQDRAIARLKKLYN
jgi:putative component of toxin-antitoxin plasmid stabilization module